MTTPSASGLRYCEKCERPRYGTHEDRDEPAALPAEPHELREAVTAYLRWHAASGMGDPVTPTWQRMKDALAEQEKPE